VGRLTDLFKRHSLDDRLLSGELSPDSGEGKTRAEQLTSPHHRAQCAQALRDIVEEAQKPRASLFNANLRVQRALIRENEALILSLAREVEEPAVVNPLGVIMADRLVRDGESPFYITEAGIEENGQLVRQVERARAALKGG
jgi:hypothetical protein